MCGWHIISKNFSFTVKKRNSLFLLGIGHTGLKCTEDASLVMCMTMHMHDTLPSPRPIVMQHCKIGSNVIAKNRNPANKISVNFMPSYRKTPHKSGYRKTNCKNRIVFTNFILFWVPCISRSREVGLLWKPIVSIWKLKSSSFLQIWLDHKMGIPNMYNITTR